MKRVCWYFLLPFAICSSNIPSLRLCRPSDNNLKQCEKELVENTKLALLHGIPQLGVLPNEPLKVSHCKITHNTMSPKFEFVSEYSNMQIFNFALADFYNVSSELDESSYLYRGFATVPEIRATTDFNYPNLIVGGKNLSCSGEAVWTYRNANFEINVTGTVKENGDGFATTEVTDVKLNIYKADFSISLVSTDFPERALELNTIINNSPAEVFRETIQVYQEVYSTALKNAMNYIVAHVYVKY